ncbi:hypothetical protein BO94DRAFT_278188 [Aspergillus sclerotioniger CBS 115572]|uniref:Protein kinase domain-containing protein n=1 Tax=Aspergillus sclerotioniger CBS 115572 TaxID=1450535 RepID=A0A317XC56_9EURO|nr:hypothetical protein BO94DRAFT_278188 [Aspergillus sclerotioniger CBS 115572]PWY94548.1 hypothetical protein BO94DRAFT_278188 [Aspergillus sclerotioniger CBS 115572]
MAEVRWRDYFFSNNPPGFLKGENTGDPVFLPFCAENENWELGEMVDKSRLTKENDIQFPEFTKKQAIEQLHRLGVSIDDIPRRLSNALHEFDRFFHEARVYSHISRFCPSREKIYFPRFYGVITDMTRFRFSSGYAHQRAVVLEAIKPYLSSRRVLSEEGGVVSNLPESFLKTLKDLQLSLFEQKWYCFLLKDRLRRLNVLHKIGVTHGDVKDCYFRLPGDFYDTVLYDFSASYTFSDKWPFRVNSGRPRPLE